MLQVWRVLLRLLALLQKEQERLSRPHVVSQLIGERQLEACHVAISILEHLLQDHCLLDDHLKDIKMAIDFHFGLSYLMTSVYYSTSTLILDEPNVDHHEEFLSLETSTLHFFVVPYFSMNAMYTENMISGPINSRDSVSNSNPEN